MILCDTNIFISAFNKRMEAIAKMQEIGFENIVISSITAMELYRGMNNKSELNQMKKHLKYYDFIHISKEISEKAVELIHSFHLSHNLQIPDAIIGATAIIYEIPLFTYNIKDFIFMPKLELYK